MKRLFWILCILTIIFYLGVIPAEAQEPTGQRCGKPSQTLPGKIHLPVIVKEVNTMAVNTDLWWVVIPESTTNLVLNPSAEKDLTGYAIIDTLGGGSIARSTVHQRRGVYSIKVSPSAGVTDGIKYSISLSTVTWYTFSVDVRGEDGEGYVVDIYDSATSTVLESISFIADGAWARYAVRAKTGTNTTIDVRVYKNNDANTFGYYVDGFQVEQKLYATDYCDGDQDGCRWAAGAHQSTSSRQEQFSGAGRPVSLFDYDFNVGGPTIGAGMTSVQITADRPALGEGTVFRRQSLLERITSIPGFLKEDDLQALHATRSQLLQIFNPNRFATLQPIHLRYIGSGKTLDCAFYYQDGLGGKIDGCESEFIESLRLYAADPFWLESDRIFNAVDISEGIGTGDSASTGAASNNGGGGNDVAFAATTQEDIVNVNYIIQKDSLGDYSRMGTGLALAAPGILSSAVNSIAIAPDGTLYVGGVFTTVGGATVNRIARWDGANWTALNNGMNGIVYSVAVAPDGTLYAGGLFTLADGVANTAYIAKWDGANWTALGTGMNNWVKTVAVAPDGTVYAGGAFTLAGGVANTAYIAKWDGAVWTPLTTGMNAAVNSIDIASDGTTLYVGGTFTTSGGVTTNRIAKWDGVAWTALGTGMNNIVWGVAVASDGTVYAGGTFTTSGGVTTNRIAKWDGVAWTALGTGMNVYVNAIAVAPDGTFYAGGNFTTSGGVTTNYIAKWEGAAWTALGTGMNNEVRAIVISPDETLFVGGLFTVSGGVTTNYIAKWSGVSWRTIAEAAKQILQAMDGKIYVGGGYTNAGGVANADYIAYWDTIGGDWNALSTGTNGIVQAIAEAPNGDIYIGGSFPLAGGVGNTVNIAYWDISASVWLPLSTGVNGTVSSLAIAPNGDLYIGGLFLDAGGVADTKNLAMWDGAAFNALSAEPNSAVNDLRFNSAGQLYIGGAFTDIGGTTYDYVALYTPSTDTFSALENGSNGFVNSIDIGPDGSVYLGGTFTQAGSVAANYVVCWNGTAFSPLGDGLNNVAYVVRTDPTGLVHVGGAFTEAGGISLPDKIAVWNGSNWVPLDVDLPGTAAVEAILFAQTITVFGFDTSGTAVAAKVN